MAINDVIASPDARAEASAVDPARLTLMASQVSDAFSTKTRVKADEVERLLPAGQGRPERLPGRK